MRLFVRGRPEVEVTPGPTDTLGHVVEAAGVPLPEVGGLLLDGAPVPPSA
ncbi:MAG: hypothetical protein M3P93_17405, partial [Actinomycetota bacterium]|nr:hypothetical protein [Actinomycetota bacterium]